MAETLRELVVALSLDSSNFSRNMRTINAQIKEAESTFRLAGAGVQNYEKTIAGTEAKLSMLGQNLVFILSSVFLLLRSSDCIILPDTSDFACHPTVNPAIHGGHHMAYNIRSAHAHILSRSIV